MEQKERVTYITAKNEPANTVKSPLLNALESRINKKHENIRKLQQDINDLREKQEQVMRAERAENKLKLPTGYKCKKISANTDLPTFSWFKFRGQRVIDTEDGAWENFR